MKQHSPISWFEIVTKDIHRAIQFYQSVFDIQFTEEKTGENIHAIFPYIEGQTGGALVYGDCYKYNQSNYGSTIIYLNAPAIAKTLSKIEKAGGKIVFPAMDIGENGFIAGFEDSEGNFIGLWSMEP